MKKQNAAGKDDRKRRTSTTTFKELQERLAHHLARLRRATERTSERPSRRGPAWERHARGANPPRWRALSHAPQAALRTRAGRVATG